MLHKIVRYEATVENPRNNFADYKRIVEGEFIDSDSASGFYYSLPFDETRRIEVVAVEQKGCPRCGGVLAAFSPSGNGVAACDACGIYFE